jgi:hypothetical protein
MAVLESGRRTAEAGSSIRTFLHGSKLQSLAVLRPRWKTAELGSFTAGLQCCEPGMPQTADLGSSTAALGRLPIREYSNAGKTASLGSFTAAFKSCTLNCRARQFYGRFSVMQDSMSENCRPWQFYGRFSEMDKTGRRTAGLGSFMATDIKLQSLAVLWPVFRDGQNRP